MSIFFFFNDTATTEIYTLSLHDALPIFQRETHFVLAVRQHLIDSRILQDVFGDGIDVLLRREAVRKRSEEHTSELQSQSNLVCRLLLEKKKQRGNRNLSILTVQSKFSFT